MGFGPARWAGGLLALALMGVASAPAWAQEDESGEGPPPTSVEDSKVPIERLLRDPIEQKSIAPVLKEGVKVQPKHGFWQDMQVNLNLRSYYLNRDKYDATYQEAWAVGGSLSIRSGWLWDRLAFGLGVYGSAPLYAPEDRDGTLLLAPGQEAYGCLGQLYGDLKVFPGVVLSAGRKEYNTPYINKNDNRMTPNSFEAYTLIGKHGGKDCCPEFVWGGGYFTKIKERNDDEFRWMSHDAGVQSVDNGVWVAGAKVSTKQTSIGAIVYHCEDVLDIGYAEGSWKPNPNGRFGLRLAAQLSYEQSTGANLLTGSEFSTFEWGAKAEASHGALMGTLAFTSTDQGRDLTNPWSSCPGYTSVQVQDFNRAGEQALMGKLAVDLCQAMHMGGWTTYALYVHGWDRLSGPDEDELDLDLQYRPYQAQWKAFSFRLRYAYVHQPDTNDTLQDLRFIVNYDIQLP